MLQAGNICQLSSAFSWNILTIQIFNLDEKPDVDYADIGGLDLQKQEIREAVELPLTHFGNFQRLELMIFLKLMVCFILF